MNNAPLTKAPEDGTKVFVPSFAFKDLFFAFTWGNTQRDQHMYLRRGIVYATKEAAIAHAQAALKLGKEGIMAPAKKVAPKAAPRPTDFNLTTHASIIKALLDGKTIQMCSKPVESSGWFDLTPDQALYHIAVASPSNEYRIKPEYIMIGDVKVPKPLTDAPEHGTVLYYPDITHVELVGVMTYLRSGEYPHRLLTRGMLHLTREAAEAHAKAMIVQAAGPFGLG